MTGRNDIKGRGTGRAGRANGRGNNGRGRGQGYQSRPKITKIGLCKELEGHIFDYGVPNAADLMRTTQEKIAQYVGIKYSEDIANELANKTTVTVAPPKYSQTIVTRHQAWETLVKRKQINLLAALQERLNQLRSESRDNQDVIEIASVENQIDDLEYEQSQEVPYKMTEAEKLEYSNESKSHSARVAALEKHRGNVYALIYGQCTQILQDKMKQDKKWITISASYKPLELYKLIERVTLKQTEDQYPIAALWEQLCNVTNAKQGNLTNNEWYDRFNTKVEVAESVGVSFEFKRIWQYCAQESYKKSYEELQPEEKSTVRTSARERFLSFALLKTSSSRHDKIRGDLSDDYTKGSDNYPQTRSQVLMLMDHYTKMPTVVTPSEGTAFAQKGTNNKKGKKDNNKSDTPKDPKDYDKEYWKDRQCYRCGKKGHPASACKIKPLSDDDDKSCKSTKSKKSSSDVGKMLTTINKQFKTMGKAMTQLHEEIADYDDDSIEEQSHVQLGCSNVFQQTEQRFSFATAKLLLKEHLLLDNQSSVHVFCNPNFVENVRTANRHMVLTSNGGQLPIKEVANIEGFEKNVWFSTKAMTNILSLMMVKSEYNVSYDGDDFIIHRAANGYSDMVFKPHPCGLHVYDPDDPRGPASYSFFETVEGNKSLFTKRQIKNALMARNLHAGLGYPTTNDLKWALQANLIQDCPVTATDLDVALKVWGPSIAMLKGKTVRTTPPIVKQDVIEVPKEIRELHKRVTLTIDIFFVNNVPFFATYSLVICFLSVTHLSDRKASTIFTALQHMCNYYLQRGYQVVFIRGDGEFAPLDEKMSLLYGAPKLNLASAHEHVPEIERRIRVIKERVRAVIYSMPFNGIPMTMLIHAVLFVTKQLNLFPVKGSISARFSPKQMMSGENTIYKNCSMGFGRYCQIHEDSIRRNSLAARTQGALSLGPSGNAQGGHKFYTLSTGKVVVRRAWTELPMPSSVIDRVHHLAKGQPVQLSFNDRSGIPIGDIDANFSHESVEHSSFETHNDLPGVFIPASDTASETPGVYIPEPTDAAEIPGVDMEPTVQIVNDLDYAPTNDEAPLVVTSEVEDILPYLPTDDEPRRSSRIRNQTKNYVPTMSGKRYSFAVTELGRGLLDNIDNGEDKAVSFSFMQQLSVKAALKEWGREAKDAGEKEASQLHWRKTFVPKRMSELTHDEQTKVLESHMFIVRKRTGETKARIVAGGNMQRNYLSKQDSSSPTVSTDSVLLTSIIDASEKRDVAIIDIPNAFIQTRVIDKKDRVILRMRGIIVDWIVKVAPEVYTDYVNLDKRGNKQLLVECHNAIYGTMVAGLLYYRKFAATLTNRGFIVNPYDPCVWNKEIKKLQCTICFHVDDCKISHMSPEVVECVIGWLRDEYESVFADGSGKMKVARGKLHRYLGMTMDFTTPKIVKITMLDYVDDVVEAWDKANSEINSNNTMSKSCKRIMTAAPDDLFKVDEVAIKLDPAMTKVFHNIVAKALYISKRARPDASLAIAFLTTRVRSPDVDDWRKLHHLIIYLRSTRELPLVLGADGTGVLSWYVDASFAVHPDMRGHTGGLMTMGRGCPMMRSTKAKLNTRSSTESELVAVDDLIPQILWARLFLKEQGFKVMDNILYQDNKSAILLEKNGRTSSSKRTKHIEIRYYYVADRIAKKDLKVVWCPTDQMIADFLTKPLQGKAFVKFRNLLMGAK